MFPPGVKDATTSSLTIHYAMQDVLVLILAVLNVSTVREVMNAKAATRTTLDAPSAIQVVSHVSEDASVYAMHALSATATAMAAMADVKEYRPAYLAMPVRVVFLDVKVTTLQVVQGAMLTMKDAELDMYLHAIEVRQIMGVSPATLDARMKMFVPATLLVLNAFRVMQVIPVQAMTSTRKMTDARIIIKAVVCFTEANAITDIQATELKPHVPPTILRMTRHAGTASIPQDRVVFLVQHISAVTALTAPQTIPPQQVTPTVREHIPVVALRAQEDSIHL
jgi:hypothetical protein